jgi:hypothetical protein
VDAVEAVGGRGGGFFVEGVAGVGFPVFGGAQCPKNLGQGQVFENVGKVAEVGIGHRERLQKHLYSKYRLKCGAK